MAQVVIELLREAPFLKGGQVFRGADMDDPNLGNIRLESEPFIGKVIGVRTERPHFNGEKGRWYWDTNFLSEDDFKKEVSKCAIIGADRRIIKYEDINFYDINDDFFTDDKFSVILTGGKCVLDTDMPHHKIMAAMFLADSRFVRVEGEAMPNYGDEIYSIGFAEAVEKARIENSQVSLDVASSIKQMPRKALLVLAKIWNMYPSNKVSDDKIRAELYDYIQRDANSTRMKSRGQFYLRFAKLSPEKLDVFNTFMDGIKARLITRSTDDELYVFNSRELGRDEEESVEFLYSSANQQLLKDLIAGIKLKAPKKLREETLVLESQVSDNDNKPSNT